MAEREAVQSRSFSPAFKQICTFVAIKEIRDSSETLRRLVCNCFAELSGDALSTGREVSAVLDTLYGLRVPAQVSQDAIDQLVRREDLQRSDDGKLYLREDLTKELQRRTDSAQALEEKVKSDWLQEIEEKHSALPPHTMWTALQAYLFRAFRRHGIQAAALLDPNIEIAPEYSESLSQMLVESVDDLVERHLRLEARQALSDFLAAAPTDKWRSTYLTQLADGAFSYFSLTVPPEAAESLRTQLRPLKLFLDTNFIFGLVDLGGHVWGDFAQELLDLTQGGDLPFEIVYHEATDREANATVQHYESFLSGRSWGGGLARAALNAKSVPGVVRQYLSEYLKNGTDVQTFFRPYRHLDELLGDRNIRKYLPPSERLVERATLEAEYEEFLAARGRHKRRNALGHDATLLDAVREIRTGAARSIDAGALLLTYDYNLYRFDWESSRRSGGRPSVALPNLFWQVIRPFIELDEEFDRSFAETFALPEFRTLGSDSAAACARVLAILASYEGVSEETATRLLSNDLLLEELKTTEDAKFEGKVRDALAEENRRLAEEIQRMDSSAKRVVDGAARQIEETNKQRATAEGEVERLRGELRNRPTVSELEQLQEARKVEAGRAAQQESEAELATQRATSAERKAASLEVAVSVLLGCVVAWGLGLLPGVAEHSKEASIRFLGGIGTALGFYGFLKPEARKIVWWGSGGAIVFVAILISLL